jgi:hypothetical protein
MILKFDLISQEPSDSSESLDELKTFLRFVGDELKFGTKVGIVIADPLCKRFWFSHYIVWYLSFCIAEDLRVLFLKRSKDKHLCVSLYWVLKHISARFNVFIKHNCL